MPAEWVLTEKGETSKREVKDGFRIVATMTPPDHSAAASQHSVELSPALYNRFSVINMVKIFFIGMGFLLIINSFYRKILPPPQRLWMRLHS